jgi:hypothetical protein
VAVFLSLLGCQWTAEPHRPGNVPTSAVWVNGAFIECSVRAELQVNDCAVYKDSTGEVLESGWFILSSTGREATRAELKYTGYGAHVIHLQDEHLLMVGDITGMYNKLVFLAGHRSIEPLNCGRVILEEPNAASSACALKAFANRKPFFVWYVLQGIDSNVSAGLAGDASGNVYFVQYDSAGFTTYGAPLPEGAELSDLHHVYTEACPKPVKLRKTKAGRVTCRTTDDPL